MPDRKRPKPDQDNPPGSLRRRQRQERQSDILQAAIEVIAERGYHNTRISDIAEKAGVAYGLVYHYFGSKENILSSLFENLWERFGERIARISAQEIPATRKLAEISDYMLDTFIARPDIIKILVHEIVHSHHIPDLPQLEIVRRIIGQIENIFQAAIVSGELSKDADTRLLSFAFFGAIEMLLTALVTGVYDQTSTPDSRQLKEVKRNMRAFIHGGSFGG